MATNLLFAERCRLCSCLCLNNPDDTAALRAVCLRCRAAIWASVTPAQLTYCLPGYVLTVASAACYQGSLKKLVYRFKYDGDCLLAYDLAFLLVQAWVYAMPCLNGLPVVFVPIPLHVSRLAARGYNHAELLAREAGRVLQVPVDTEALRRVKATPPQHGLGQAARWANLAGAFAGNHKRLANKAIVLVDDICTSGATMCEAARAAFAAGATCVVGLTVARARTLKSQ
ncbi:MAG: ComF family protein [Candidatus Melainabacteria bacterium]|nr:ComF family protein [Candidatus Melainabacteria bacterium]